MLIPEKILGKITCGTLIYVLLDHKEEFSLKALYNILITKQKNEDLFGPF